MGLHSAVVHSMHKHMRRYSAAVHSVHERMGLHSAVVNSMHRHVRRCSAAVHFAHVRVCVCACVCVCVNTRGCVLLLFIYMGTISSGQEPGQEPLSQIGWDDVKKYKILWYPYSEI